MRLFIFIFIVFVQFSFSASIPTIHTISDLPKEKDIILVFSMEHCPYCSRQENSLISKVQPKFPDIALYKTLRGTKVFETLIQTGNFGEVDYFPTTFILVVDENENIFVKYPFQGYQRSSSIIKILNDNEIMDY